MRNRTLMINERVKVAQGNGSAYGGLDVATLARVLGTVGLTLEVEHKSEGVVVCYAARRNTTTTLSLTSPEAAR